MNRPRRIDPGPLPPEELDRFLETYLYEPEGFLISAVTRIDREKRELEAKMDTTQPLPIASLQRITPGTHPRHVTAPELLLLTGNLGCLHAYFIHGCRWDEGWVGFGNRIHRADFRDLVRIGPALDLTSRETRTRAGTNPGVRCQVLDWALRGSPRPV